MRLDPFLNRDQIFMILNLNAVMSIIANVPAAIASTVSSLAACIRSAYKPPIDRRLPRRASVIELHFSRRRGLRVCHHIPLHDN